MPTQLLTLRTGPGQMARFTRAARDAKAKSRHAWALAVLEQAAARVSDEDNWIERRFRWVDEQGVTIPEDALQGERSR